MNESHPFGMTQELLNEIFLNGYSNGNCMVLMMVKKKKKNLYLRFSKYLIVEMITGARFRRHPRVQGLSFSVWLL